MIKRKKGSDSISGIRLRAVRMALVIATVLVLTGLAPRPAPAQGETWTYTVLYSFTDGTDGANPLAGLITDAAGNLYGTASAGGAYGGGVVFRLDGAGNETVLYAFTGGADGATPQAGLIWDAAGNLYGTTYRGGNLGCGVVFKLDPAGNGTVLYTFTGGADGANPAAGLIRDRAGNLYGTTYGGGNFSCYYGSGCGVVFMLDPAGNETVLYSFTGGADGAWPEAGLIRDAAGNLYGTASGGGDLSCNHGISACGVIFKLDPTGNETVLYSFTGLDGYWPLAGLIRDRAGNLYGTTNDGGGSEFSGCFGLGCGVVFSLDPAGNETVLHSFTGLDGLGPQAGLIRDRAGNLYGTAVSGGIFSDDCSYGPGCGVVFKLDPAGHYRALYSFTGGSDGAFPRASLRPYKGALYGTASGGPSGWGVVFKLTPP